MPLQLTVITEDDLTAFHFGTLDRHLEKSVRGALENDDRAQRLLEKIKARHPVNTKRSKTKENDMTANVLDVKTNVSKLDTGISNRSDLADQLGGCLADTLLLMIKTQAYHWNVSGPLFVPIHELTETHYQDLFAAVDELAERIRTLGYPAPFSSGQMSDMAAIDEEQGKPTAQEMIETLVVDHQKIAQRLRDAALTADKSDDIATADMLTARIAFHEKAVWMLKSIAA